MQTPNERLKQAREAAGYDTAAEAARALGINEVTYTSHENSTRGLSRSAERYAAFYRVSLDWLMRGRGQMRGRQLSTIADHASELGDLSQAPKEHQFFLVRGTVQQLHSNNILVERNELRTLVLGACGTLGIDADRADDLALFLTEALSSAEDVRFREALAVQRRNQAAPPAKSSGNRAKK